MKINFSNPEVNLKSYALLCGSAPDGLMQKKVDSMYDSLLTENGGRFEENEIMIFPNGIDEASLVYVLNNLKMSGIEQIFLYVCTVTPVSDSEKTVWLGGYEIKKTVFEKSASLAEFVLAGGEDTEQGRINVQVIYDCDREFIDGNDYYLDSESASDVFASGEVRLG